MTEEIKEKIEKTEFSEEMKKAYIDYAMSVIVSRALPSAEDGLKPVHRRILYAMYKMGLTHDKATVKSARIVGEVIGKYHPHGDAAVYDALVRMAQDFSMRYPLIHGQGNFGSIDGDPPAAYRYTEAKLSKISDELLEDLEKDTVIWQPNFDNTLKEPLLLPAKLPNLLINGSSGIAVGMATNIPPHNLSDVCDAIIAYLDDPSISIEKLLDIIKGPDFPTGGYVDGSNLIELYTKGKASIIMRGKISIEKIKGNKEAIVITEIPYQLNKSTLIEKIAQLVSTKKLSDISDIRDESSKGKIRIVLELRRGANANFTINNLYHYTPLQSNFDAIMLALVDGQPKLLNLKEIIEIYVNHRKNVIKRRTAFDLKKAEERKHIVEGLLIALKDIDKIIEIIKKSKNSKEAEENLVKKFSLTQKQSQAILEMKLSSLTSLETEKLKEENKKLEELIKELKKILGDEKEVIAIIKKDLQNLKKIYGDNRRTTILQKVKEISEKDLIEKKQVIITITAKGYVKRVDEKTYKEQRRGGKGVIGSDLATDDFVSQIITCSTHDYLLFFTNNGKVYWLKAYQIPPAERYSKGKAIVNILNIKNDKITSVIPISKFEDYLIIVTKKGIIKKLPLSLLNKPRNVGIRVINLPLDNSDNVVDVKKIKENQEIIIVTAKGQAIRFDEKEVRPMSRISYGVCGIKLENDFVVSMEVVDEKTQLTLFTISEKGYGKRSKIEDYRKTARGGKGVINMKITQKTGEVCKSLCVGENDSVIISTLKGIFIKIKVKDIRVMGRSTQGVRIIKLKEGDKVSDAIRVSSEVN